jgi:hypothetical protein
LPYAFSFAEAIIGSGEGFKNVRGVFCYNIISRINEISTPKSPDKSDVCLHNICRDIKRKHFVCSI